MHQNLFLPHLAFLFSFATKYKPSFSVVPIDLPVFPSLGLLAVVVISTKLLLINIYKTKLIQLTFQAFTAIHTWSCFKTISNCHCVSRVNYWCTSVPFDYCTHSFNLLILIWGFFTFVEVAKVFVVSIQLYFEHIFKQCVFKLWLRYLGTWLKIRVLVNLVLYHLINNFTQKANKGLITTWLEISKCSSWYLDSPFHEVAREARLKLIHKPVQNYFIITCKQLV